MSKEARDLIRRLITDTEDRLGSKEGADEIKRHPFFSPIDWNVPMRSLPAPYRPEMRDDYGLSNFDHIEDDDEDDDGRGDAAAASAVRGDNGGGDGNNRPAVNGGGGGDDDRRHSKDYIGFYEFTFRRFFDDTGHPLPLRISTSGADQQQQQQQQHQQQQEEVDAGAVGTGGAAPDPVYV